MTIDLTTMWVNLSKSLPSVQALLTGLAYMFGIVLIYNALDKLRLMMNAGRSSREHMFPAVANLLGGGALLFLPTMVSTLANTVFGWNNILQYTTFQNTGLLLAIKYLIQTAGVIWFFRGVILLVHSSEPGVEEGGKGLAMMFAGIFGIYFDDTLAAMNYILDWIMNHLTLNSITSLTS